MQKMPTVENEELYDEMGENADEVQSDAGLFMNWTYVSSAMSETPNSNLPYSHLVSLDNKLSCGCDCNPPNTMFFQIRCYHF